MRKIDVTFVSNYINHHQIPFCESMCSLLKEEGGSFAFVQTEPMEEERVKMGWKEEKEIPYVHRFYEEEAFCRRLIAESDVVLFGGCDDERYIEERLKAGKPVVRISERLYKTGQWKAVSPRGLMKKYRDHTRYRKAPVYLLCAGGYVASDFHIVRAYPGKMYQWGYFPRTKRYDVDKLMEGKGWPAERNSRVCNDADKAGRTDRIPYLLWAGRFIDWKHPELALETAEYLRNKNIAFHMDIIGGGEMERELAELLAEKNLSDRVSMPGFRTPEEVRGYMERADIFLFTSDRQEGWGAVLNEAMNSGCAVAADHMIGAVPYLIRQGYNGRIYRDGDREALFKEAERLSLDYKLRDTLGRNAYETIAEIWNPENAAGRLLELLDELLREPSSRPEAVARKFRYNGILAETFPCAPEVPVPERKMYRRLCRESAVSLKQKP